MDLPTCPTCGQSVLDEEAEVCPFCGASMSAPRVASEPVSRAKPTETPAPAAGSAVQAPPRRSERSGVTPTPDEELDPISADAAEEQAAFRVRRKRAKGLSLPVKCPMCDVTGWVPKKLAGQQVRCPDPSCMVPLFTAPIPEERPKPTEEVEEAPSRSLTIPIVLAASTLIGVGVWVYVVVFGPTGEVTTDNGGKPSLADVAEQLGNGQGNGDSVDPTPETNTTVPAEPDHRKLAIARMISLSQNAPRVEQPIGRQRTAIAMIRLGRVANAQDQLDTLQSLRAGTPFMRVAPLVAMAWAKMAESDDAAAADFAAAMKAAAAPPRSGRAMTKALADLAALAIVRGVDEAKVEELLASDRNSPVAQRLAVQQRTAELLGHFKLETEIALEPLEADIPIDRLVIANLVVRGHASEALAFCESTSGTEDAATRRLDRLIALGELAATDGKAAAVADQVRKALPESARAVLAARIATRELLLQTGNPDAARSEAERLVAALPAPKPATLPSLKVLHAGSHGMGRSRPWNVLAALELARARAASGAPIERSWEAFDRATAFADGYAPSPRIMSDRLRELAVNPSGLEADVKETFQVADATAIRNIVIDYTTQLRKLDETTRRPVAIRARFLAGLVTSENATEVWSRLNEETLGNLSTVPEFTGLAGRLMASLEPTESQAVRDRLGRLGVVPVPKSRPSARELVEGSDAGAPKSDVVQASGGDQLVLQVALALLDRDGLEASFDFLDSLADVVLAAEGSRLVTAAATLEPEADYGVIRKRINARRGAKLAQITALEGLLLALPPEPAADPELDE